MSRFVAYFQGYQLHLDRDAWSARLAVHRDGEYFQFVTVGVSGRALLNVGLTEPRAEFMSHLARISMTRCVDAITSCDIPLPNPTTAFPIWVDDHATVRECSEATALPLNPGDTAWTIEA